MNFGNLRIALIVNIVGLFAITSVSAQTSYHAIIVNVKDSKPIAYASVSINKKRIGILADAHGNINLPTSNILLSDTLDISSVGFSPLKISLADARKVTVIRLYEASGDMENVIIKSYLNEAVEGNKVEVSGYFRSWPTKSKGGEIGKIFIAKADEILVDRIRFKVNNQCQACQVRVRIRAVSNGYPAEELFVDSISMPVKKLNFDDRYTEFDLSSKNIVIKQKELFVSLEVLYCSGEPCSFCFIGTEPGTFMYKNKGNTDWLESASHNLYLRFYYKY
ncbi:MAG: hypothetical protein ABIT96_08910 [Ferruginibacter sp.]